MIIDHVKRWLCDYVMSGTCRWSLLRSSLVLGRGGDGGRWTIGLILFGSSLILFGSSLILFGSSLILFGSSLILFGSSPILFGSSLILFGSSSTFGTSKRGAEESGWKKCLKIWACLKSKPVDWVLLLLPASYPSGKMCQRILRLLQKITFWLSFLTSSFKPSNWKNASKKSEFDVKVNLLIQFHFAFVVTTLVSIRAG